MQLIGLTVDYRSHSAVELFGCVSKRYQVLDAKLWRGVSSLKLVEVSR